MRFTVGGSRFLRPNPALQPCAASGQPSTANHPTANRESPMAQPLDYTYPPGLPGQDTFTAADDLARLVETLHTSGTLRVLNGLLAEFQGVMAVVLSGLNTEAGRTGLANMLTLGKLLGHVDADGLDRFAVALERGLAAAGDRLTEADADDAPGTLTVLKKLREPEVRRGLDAALTLLGTLGAELHRPQPEPYSQHDGKRGAQP